MRKTTSNSRAFPRAVNRYSPARRRRQSGVVLLLACLCVPVLVGMMGLATDVSILYSVKTKLQQSVDGAALAGLRSVSVSQSISGQQSVANSVATNWFNANFAGNFLGVSGTVLTTPTLTNVSSTITVTVTAQTNVPSYFMKYFNRGATTVSATGLASRRVVNIMMVLDRSGSMDWPAAGTFSTNGLPTSGSACKQMIAAAKQFTGMFTAGIDNVGAVSFAQTGYVMSSPTTNFQTVLGYSNSGGSSNGALDQIVCWGGTNTSTALALAWNELYKMQLPGAFNAILLFTDGYPTAASFNMNIPASVDPTGSAKTAILSTSTCKDANGNSGASADHLNHPANWIRTPVGTAGNSGTTINLGSNSYFGPFSGEILSIYTDNDPHYNPNLQGGMYTYTPAGGTISSYEKIGLYTDAPGCAFSANNLRVSPSSSASSFSWYKDFNFLPPTDLFGTSVFGYLPTNPQMIQGGLRIQAASASDAKDNTTNAAFNLTDNIANFARNPVVNGTAVTYKNGSGAMPQSTLFVIGLGSNGGVNHTLLQRIANDPRADPTGQNLYPAYTAVANQPQGIYYYSPTASQLSAAFSQMASSTLRLAQ